MNTTLHALKQTRTSRRRINPEPRPQTLLPDTTPLATGPRHLTPPSGVALVITLVMLAVITFMAVTFLVLSHRERGAVVTSTDQSTAGFSADTAFERATAEILARMLAQTNDQDYDLIVSTNFINRVGFDPGAEDYRTNINFDRNVQGVPLYNRPVQALRNLTNLLYSPRPPVYVANYTNGVNDFRFYLDLNRNGRYETNGYLPAITFDPDNPYYNRNTGLTMSALNDDTLSNVFVGDPEWIGILEHPNLPHSANNKFIARYAYLVLPEGKTLDVNYIHNDAALDNYDSGSADWPYRRNMGVGTWEINLAAFLADLNTNQWNQVPGSTVYYEYLRPWLARPEGSVAHGIAFEDAQAFLNHRYNGVLAWGNLKSLDEAFPTVVTAFESDRIDAFGGGGPIGSYMTGTELPPPLSDSDFRRISLRGWPGADNTNHFFTPQEFYDPRKTSGTPPPYPPNVPGFTNRLMAAGAERSSYDRYTFYRMLAQLGTDSASEQTRINVNYANIDGDGRIIRGWETNLFAWNPGRFFALGAQRMFEQLNLLDVRTNLICITNIPIYALFYHTNADLTVTTTNYSYYTPAVHRILQLTANIVDATTNRMDLSAYPYLPHVFRPLFRKFDVNGDDIRIVGYREVIDARLTESAAGNVAPIDLDLADDRRRVLSITESFRDDPQEAMVYGYPLIIGAKKGFPSFNEFSMQNMIEVIRKLEFRRPASDPNGEVIETNQMYTLSISNIFGVEAWNSYTSSFPRQLRMNAIAEIRVTLTNELGGNVNILLTNMYMRPYQAALNANTWTGWIKDEFDTTPSIQIPLNTSTNLTGDTTTPYETWRPFQPDQLVPLSRIFDRNGYFPVPRWWLQLGARVRFFLVDTTVSPNRIVDYVNLSRTENVLDVTSALQDLAGGAGEVNRVPIGGSGNPWGTNRFGSTNSLDLRSPTYGVMNQIVRNGVKLGPSVGVPKFVIDSIVGTSYEYAIDFFRYQFNPSGYQFVPLWADNLGKPFYKTNIFYTPLVPAAALYTHITWQANDPLVHYMIGDLVWQQAGTNVTTYSHNPPLDNLGKVNQNYEPWFDGTSGNTQNPGTDPQSPTRTELSVKDPGIRRSDDWDFPTNRLPNVGWLGRVHRGTPWQTVYLKAADNVERWGQWARMQPEYRYFWRINETNFMDSMFQRPVMDRDLFDVFTAGIHGNANRGRLSINQTNLAAWSAVLSGVIALTNSATFSDLLDFATGIITNTPRVEPILIEPAGIYMPDRLTRLARIVEGINVTRANTNIAGGLVYPHQSFQRLGDILAVPELSIGLTPEYSSALGSWTNVSPYLYLGDVNIPVESRFQQLIGITDPAYERIPQQIMGLLTLSHTPRFVIYSYGQTLHPAERSIYTGNDFFGLCTNYQVTAETATRAVVRVEGALDPKYTAEKPDFYGSTYPPRIVVEQFNVLPPD